ncbi:hypothetical protein GCM10028808_13630 [Spirosoma migulaei]
MVFLSSTFVGAVVAVASGLVVVLRAKTGSPADLVGDFTGETRVVVKAVCKGIAIVIDDTNGHTTKDAVAT